MKAYEIVTGADLDAATRVFESRAEAQLAADGAMSRRKHHRPYAQSSGYHSARAGGDRWIVMAYPNIVMLRSGAMYDYQRGRIIR